MRQRKFFKPPPQNLWVSSGCFGRPAPQPRIFKASLRYPMDLARMPKDRYARGAWRNGVGLRGDATWQGIFRPMVRRRCIRPRLADGVRGGFVLRHRTPESCLKIPLPSGILGVKHARAFCTSNCRASDLFRKVLYIKMLRSQLPADHPRIPRRSRFYFQLVITNHVGSVSSYYQTKPLARIWLPLSSLRRPAQRVESYRNSCS